MINKEAPFPQANDFNKVVYVLNVPDEAQLKDYSRMKIYLGDITERQVDYYIAACIYLGFIDKNKTFTKDGIQLRKKAGVEQISEIARIIVTDEVFGTVYFQELMLGVIFEKEDVIEVMKRNIKFDSEAMYLRRASTVLSWVKWIRDHEAK